jgi:hypothetical protein
MQRRSQDNGSTFCPGGGLPEKAKLEKKTFFGERQQQAQHTIANQVKTTIHNACV